METPIADSERQEGSPRRTANRQVHLSKVRFDDQESRISSAEDVLRVTGNEIVKVPIYYGAVSPYTFLDSFNHKDQACRVRYSS